MPKIRNGHIKAPTMVAPALATYKVYPLRNCAFYDQWSVEELNTSGYYGPGTTRQIPGGIPTLVADHLAKYDDANELKALGLTRVEYGSGTASYTGRVTLWHVPFLPHDFSGNSAFRTLLIKAKRIAKKIGTVAFTCNKWLVSAPFRERMKETTGLVSLGGDLYFSRKPGFEYMSVKYDKATKKRRASGKRARYKRSLLIGTVPNQALSELWASIQGMAHRHCPGLTRVYVSCWRNSGYSDWFKYNLIGIIDVAKAMGMEDDLVRSKAVQDFLSIYRVQIKVMAEIGKGDDKALGMRLRPLIGKMDKVNAPKPVPMAKGATNDGNAEVVSAGPGQPA